jgi:hypothetical protein
MTKHLLLALAAAGLLAGLSTSASAQLSLTPGHQYQDNSKTSVDGKAGASGYTPGYRMQTEDSVEGNTGASGYAPGRLNSDTSVNSNADIRAGGVKTHGNVGAGAKTWMK